MKRLTLLIASLFVMANAHAANRSIDIIPKPASVKAVAGSFVVSADTPIVVESNDLASAAGIFAEEMKKDFGKPFVYKNEFYSLLGVEKTAQRGFHVTIDGIHNNNLSNAYVYENQTVVISYY